MMYSSTTFNIERNSGGSASIFGVGLLDTALMTCEWIVLNIAINTELAMDADSGDKHGGAVSQERLAAPSRHGGFLKSVIMGQTTFKHSHCRKPWSAAYYLDPRYRWCDLIMLRVFTLPPNIDQDDIGNAIKPYYDDAAGTKLSALLRDHILVATEVVKVAKAGDQLKLANAQKKWTANGKDIAAFLSGANPNWPKKTLEEMLQKHLDLTTGEVVGRLNKDWNADIKAYDDGHTHMLMLADTLSAGIAKQFPVKFNK